MDTMTKPEVAQRISDKVSMCNYRANRLVCEAADRAMQVHGASAIRATNRSSIFIATTAATASQKGPKRFKSAKWPAICLVLSANRQIGGHIMPVPEVLNHSILPRVGGWMMRRIL